MKCYDILESYVYEEENVVLLIDINHFNSPQLVDKMCALANLVTCRGKGQVVMAISSGVGSNMSSREASASFTTMSL